MVLSCPLLNSTNCSGNKYRNGSHLQFNLANLLPDLPRRASQHGFVNTSVREGQDRIFGLAICLAGISPSSCQNSLELAVKKLSAPKCSNGTSAVSWYDHCMVQYTRQLFFDVPKTSYSIHAFWSNRKANGGGLETTVYNLINNLSDSAAKNSETRFATGQVSYLLNNTSNTTTILYGLAQCTRDLSPGSCSTCLANYRAVLKNISAGSTHTGARIVGESCFLWYHDKPINNSSTSDLYTLNKPINNTTSDKNSKTGSSPPEGAGTKFHTVQLHP